MSPNSHQTPNEHTMTPDLLLESAGEPEQVVVVLSNAPDLQLAKRIAHMLVEEHLAACVNLGAPSLSMYMWEGKLEGAEKIPLQMKTTRGRLPALVERLRELHPYRSEERRVGKECRFRWVAS